MSASQSAELETSFTLRGKFEIQEKLRMMQKQRSLLTLTPKGMNSGGFLSTIIKVLPEKGLLALDSCANAELNRTVLAAGEADLATNVDGIVARFSVSGIKEATLDGHTVFATPIPDALYWLQRRRFFRMAIPYAQRLKCAIPVDEEREIEFEVICISLGGLAFLDKLNGLEPTPSVGQRFHGCHFDLPAFANETFSLEIRYALPTEVGILDKPATRYGCAIFNASRGLEITLQKFLFELEMLKKQSGDRMKE